MPSDDRALMDHGRRIGELERWRKDHAPHERGPTLGEYYATFLNLPGLRGLWYPGSVDQTGAVYDRSGQQRTLTYNGTPTINIYNEFIPYYAYGGADLHTRADEAGLDILGTETVIASAYRGLTVGGMFYANSLATAQGLISKYTAAGNQRGWVLLTLGVGSAIRFAASNTGAADVVVDSGALTAGQWIFTVGRFDPSTELALFTNNTKVANTSSIPASLFNSTAALEIGGYNGGANFLTGRWALAFLCAAALPDKLIEYLYFRGAPLFGL